MSLDLELEGWRREWSADTEPLPELRRRVDAQNRRLVFGAVAIACCLAIGTALGLRHPWSSGWGGFAIGLWAASAAGVAYTLWVRRGTWEPASQTTSAYLDVLHRRAVAVLKKTIFLRRVLWMASLGYGAFLLWRRQITVTSALVMAGLLAESLWIRALEGRRRRAADEAAALVDRMSEEAEGRIEERKEQA